MSIKVESEVQLAEWNGETLPVGTDKVLIVKNHWNRDQLVVIEIGAYRFSVSRSELCAAMANATNTARY